MSNLVPSKGIEFKVVHSGQFINVALSILSFKVAIFRYLVQLLYVNMLKTKFSLVL